MAKIFSEEPVTVGYGRKIVEEAMLINAQALKYQASRRQPISIDEAVEAVIKAQVKKEIPFASLDSLEKANFSLRHQVYGRRLAGL